MITNLVNTYIECNVCGEKVLPRVNINETTKYLISEGWQIINGGPDSRSAFTDFSISHLNDSIVTIKIGSFCYELKGERWYCNKCAIKIKLQMLLK